MIRRIEPCDGRIIKVRTRTSPKPGAYLTTMEIPDSMHRRDSRVGGETRVRIDACDLLASHFSLCRIDVFSAGRRL
jgi:hypothetical protein